MNGRIWVCCDCELVRHIEPMDGAECENCGHRAFELYQLIIEGEKQWNTSNTSGTV